MAERPWDIDGWATMCNIRCSDGRTIRPNAFIDNDGEEVPMVYQHCHTDPTNILGHALLENRDEGVYCYCWFNQNEKAQAAKNAVANGDIKQFSIYANQLVQKGNDVVHGMIREVSLVMTGANRGARIENLNFAHSDGTYDTDDEEAIITTEVQDICHSEDGMEDEDMGENKNVDLQSVLDSMDEDQLAAVQALYEQGQIDALAAAGVDPEAEDEEYDDEGDDEDFEDDDEEYDEDDEDFEDDEDDDDEDLDDEDYDDEDDDEDYEDDDEDEDVEHSEFGGYGSMKKNVFDGTVEEVGGNSLSHAEMDTIFSDAKRGGSLKDAVISHSAEYGIDQIDWLFPDYKNQNVPPEFIKREMDWVQKVMGAVHHTPFSRIKSMFADITEDEARAKGYIKGHLKKEQVFTLLKRTTDPQTVYKKQKLDRDDVLDITDFDVVAWIKGEMRMMLDEELARAFLIGDGRSTASEDHIEESHVRSIWKDDDLFTVKVPVTQVQNENFAKTIIKTIIKNRKLYKGSGDPLFFTTEDVLTEMLLLEDGIGHFLYPTKAALATTLRVRDIVTVPVMEQAGTRTDTTGNSPVVWDLIGIMVNLNDYNVGADKGGSINMFDDFDIDYNQQKYLIETRISAALVKPFSALAIEVLHNSNPLTITGSLPSKPWQKAPNGNYQDPIPEDPDDGEGGN